MNILKLIYIGLLNTCESLRSILKIFSYDSGLHWFLYCVGHLKKSAKRISNRSTYDKKQRSLYTFNMNRKVLCHHLEYSFPAIFTYRNLMPSLHTLHCFINKRHMCTDNIKSLYLTHVDKGGKAKMVDVSGKPESARIAIAEGRVYLGTVAYKLVAENKIKKGDVLSIAQLSGIMAAKATSHLIPLCHNIPLSQVDIKLVLEPCSAEVLIQSVVRTNSSTGVEMEALTAVSVAALTIYDMCKSVTHDIVIKYIQLVEKHGGKSDFVRNNHH